MIIPLDYWWAGIFTYLAAHTIHIMLWRLSTIHHQVATLLAVFLGSALFVYRFIATDGSAHLSELVAPIIVHLSLSIQYVAVYPAFQASSPTIEIINLLRKSKNLTMEELLERYPKKTLVSARVQDLVDGGLARHSEEGGLILTGPGSCIAALFIVYRKLIGLPIGEG